MALQISDSLLPQKKLKLATVPVQDDDLIQSIQNDPLGGGDDSSWDLKKEKDIDPARIQAFLDDALSEIGPQAPEDAKS